MWPLPTNSQFILSLCWGGPCRQLSDHTESCGLYQQTASSYCHCAGGVLVGNYLTTQNHVAFTNKQPVHTVIVLGGVLVGNYLTTQNHVAFTNKQPVHTVIVLGGVPVGSYLTTQNHVAFENILLTANSTFTVLGRSLL